MRASDDPYPDVLERVILAPLSNDEAQAGRVLDEIPFEPAMTTKEKWPATSVIARVYARDSYQCGYCGEKVVLLQLMRLISRLFPTKFPYQQNWKADSTHPAFISRGATLDHLVPIAGGGDPVSEANLVTSCWGCNRRKGDSLLEEIGWELVSPTDPSWQGLSEWYEPLWITVGRPPLGEDEMGWMRAIRRWVSPPSDTSGLVHPSE